MNNSVVALMVTAVTLIGTAPVAQPVQSLCRFDIDLYNRGRRVIGAPESAECSGDAINCWPFWGHSVPWGNWGVDSNGGSRFNGDQFAGWKSLDGHWQWNSCRSECPPPDCDKYNAADCTEQISEASDVQLYANFDIVSYTNSTEGCAAFDGSQFTLNGNYMDMWELDTCDEDEFVGTLHYPSLTAPRSCSFYTCGPDSSTWESPNGGDTGLLSAEISMTVSGGYDEQPIWASLWSEPKGRFASLSTRRPATNSIRSFYDRLTRANRYPVAGAIIPTRASIGTPAWGITSVQATGVLPPQTGSIVGQVTGPRTPIAAARVLVVDRTPTGFDMRTVKTSAEGRFEMSGLRPGPRDILVVAAGYGRGRAEVTVRPGTASTVEVRLERGAQIKGLVLGKDGKAVSGAKVAIRYPPERRGAAPDRIEGDWHQGILTTSEKGYFHVKDIQPHVPFELFLRHPVNGSKLVGSFTLTSGELVTDLIVSWGPN